MDGRFAELAASFPPAQVKQRRGSFGQTLDYLEAATVVHRLNEALDGQWSFRVIDTRIEADEVIVTGQLTIGDTVREQFGGSRITRHKDTGEMIGLADDLKSAASDALKKTATLAGVGLYLHGDSGSGSRNGQSNGNGRSTNHHRRTNGSNGAQHPPDDDPQANARQQSPRISNNQIARIVQVARDVGMAQKDVIQLARDSYGVVLSQLSPSQADELIIMIGG